MQTYIVQKLCIKQKLQYTGQVYSLTKIQYLQHQQHLYHVFLYNKATSAVLLNGEGHLAAFPIEG
uniref:Uncharacterized protein n=1 Tax=Hippocampus comes TaxID=109280 RepID=A0A3Q2XQF1_HIPCM